MDASSNNPLQNRLRAGLTEDQLAEAIKKSGYPLQTIVAQELRGRYSVQEEWSFIDADTRTLRTLDISAELPLYDRDSIQHRRVRPALNLLIECKQSDLPYVFFRAVGRPWTKDFPVIAGLFHDSIEIESDDNPSTWSASVMSALDLEEHTFVRDVDYSFAFSKCARKGASVEIAPDFELSGSEPFRSIVLPLVKSLRHFCKQVAPPVTAYYFDLHLVCAVAVLDAPMIAVTIDDGEQKLKAVPWIRVLRHESEEASHWSERTKLFAVDVVHKDYLATFLAEHVEPFANRFSELALKHELEIATGKGFAKGMWRQPWAIEPRLEPRRASRRAQRPISVTWHIARQIASLMRGRKRF